MKPLEIARSAILSVASNKFRVALTSLGIIIGSFTIIMVVGIGKASEDAITEQYKRLSVETITITRGQVTVSMGRGGISMGKSLTKDLALEMPDSLAHIKNVGASTSTSSPVAYGSDSMTVQVQGISASYADITHLTTSYGEFFTDDDGILRSKVAVLGYNVAVTLFGDEEDLESFIGEKVLIKGLSFEVLGILERIGGTGGVSSAGRSGSSTSPDDMVYIPYDVALKYTSGPSGGRGGISSSATTTFVALASSISDVNTAIEEVKEYIFDVVGDYTSYNVTDSGSTLSSALETSNTMSTLLMVVAAIVLIVSGIGIMNVLMVAVKERTKEIGILKSMGASRRVILSEFLLEAVIISVVGGLLGVLLSYFAPAFLSYLNVDYAASFQGLMLGFLFSVATGVFFGYYPAYKASKLKPIEALNAE
ncbi:MAG: ABC transporter permease [Clostridiales bacterium]|jgi:putative ABC transport system permease protein|nr:ABC transporter permease [Clostridiales bacterium]